MTWNLILSAVAKAKRKRLPTIRNKGKEYYVMVMTPEQFRDLSQSADYKAIVAKRKRVVAKTHCSAMPKWS